MIIRKFILSLSNKEKGELIRALADASYKGKGIVFDYLYELAGFIEQEPDKKDEPVKKAVEYRFKTPGLDLPAIVLTQAEKQLIIDRQISRAVRMVRERTAQRIHLCREAVEAYYQEVRCTDSSPIVVPVFGGQSHQETSAAAWSSDPWKPLPTNPLTPEDVDALKEYLASPQGLGSNIIRAIKWIREQRPGTGLKEAKDYVEMMQNLGHL